MVSTFETPKCDICNCKCESIAILDKHKKVYHEETEYDRIQRRTKMITIATEKSRMFNMQCKIKSYNCSECGDLFSALEEQKAHEENNHKENNPLLNRGRKREVDEIDQVDETKQNITSDYTRETYPYSDDNQTEDDAEGITFKGKSRKYIVAYNKLRSKMVEGAEFKVNEYELKIKATPKNKPIKVELTNKNGDKGNAQVQMYNPGKKGATLLITKSSGEDFDNVRTIADEFMEKFLNILLRGLITGESEITEYSVVKTEMKEVECFKCEKCDKSFTINRGLKIHSAWHTRNNVKQDSQSPEVTSFIPQTFQSCTCEWCGEKFEAELKYQAYNALLMHKKMCPNKPLLTIHPQIKQNCDICGYKGKNEKDIKKT